jgi:hypothetical protein
MKLFKLSAVASVIQMALASSAAWAVPTRQEAYRNDELGVVVYRDSEDTEIFWYLPILKPYMESGHVAFRKRARTNGNTDYTFYLLPQFPQELVEFVANEIPGLHNRQQLKPVKAKRFGLQVKQFNVAALSDEVTDYRYLNQPQMVRLSLSTDDSADFDDLFSSTPGVPVNMAIYYDSEFVQKYLKIELSYKEVYDAMNIAASGRYTFTKAEISAQMSNYLSNKYLSIKSKGDLKIPEIIEKVITQCFTPARSPMPATHFGLNIDSVDAKPATGPTADQLRRRAEAEARLREHGAAWFSVPGSFIPPGSGTGNPGGGNPLGLPIGPAPSSAPAPAPSSSSGSTPSPGSSSSSSSSNGGSIFGSASSTGGSIFGTTPTPLPSSGGSLGSTGTTPTTGPMGDGVEFTFKKELSTREERFLYDQQQMADAQEISVIPAYLTAVTAQSESRLVTQLEGKTVRITADQDQGHPLRTGVVVHAGDQWTLSASFTLAAASPYGNGKQDYYRWDSTWPKTEGDLYYRIGSGPWIKVNGRAMVGADTLQSGELQFYEARAAIWNKLPADYRTSSMLGAIAAIFPYKSTFPEFTVTLTGRHVEGPR